MKRFFFSVITLLAILASLIPVADPTLQAKEIDAEQSSMLNPPPALACYNGAIPFFKTICLVIPITRENGNGPSSYEVILRFEDRIEVLESVPVTSAAGADHVLAYDVSKLGAELTDLVSIEVRRGGEQQYRLVSLRPDPRTRTQVVDPIKMEHTVVDLSHGTIWGDVSLLNDTTPLTNVLVELIDANGKVLQTTVTTPTAKHPEPTFDFNNVRFKKSAKVTLRATYQDMTQEVSFEWQGQQVRVPIILGWACNKELPRGGGVSDLPTSYCLFGRTLIRNKPTENVLVEILIGGERITQTTKLIEDFTDPMFAIDIGQFLEGRALNEEFQIIASSGGFVGQYSDSIRSLAYGKVHGKRIDIHLTGEREFATGLDGGFPGVLEIVPDSSFTKTFIGGRYGGMYLQYDVNTSPLRIIGDTPQALISPEVSAVLWWGDSDGQAQVLIGTRGGQLAFTPDEGKSWHYVDTLSRFAIEGLAYDSLHNQVYALTRDQLYAFTFDPALATISNLISTPHAFVANDLAINEAALFASSSQGVWQSPLDTINWSLVTDTPSSSIATTAPLSSATVLVGTDAGLYKLDALVQGQVEESLFTGVVLDVAADGSDMRVSTPEGIFKYDPASNAWDAILEMQSVYQSANERSPSLETPDIFDLVVIKGSDTVSDTLYVASSTGVYSSSSGLEWSLVAPLPELEPLRSLAVDPSGAMLAVTAKALYRWANDQWTIVDLGLGSAFLNGSAVRWYDSTIIVGRHSSQGPSLFVSTDNGALWQQHSLPGNNRGVSSMVVFQPTDAAGKRALIATDGDGLFLWDGALQPLAASGLQADERVASVSAIYNQAGECVRLVLGTFEASAQIAYSACSSTPAWIYSAGLQTVEGASVGLVQAFAGGSNYVYAATNEGLFFTTLDDINTWYPIFSLAFRPLALAVHPDDVLQGQVFAGGIQSGIIGFRNTTPDVSVALVGAQQIKGRDQVVYTATVRNMSAVDIDNIRLDFTYDPPVFDAVTDVFTQPVTLRSKASLTQTFTATVAADVRPTSLFMFLDAEAVVNERVLGNNRAVLEVEVDYRDDPDPFVNIRGSTMGKENQYISSRILTGNRGTVASEPYVLEVCLDPRLGLSTNVLSPSLIPDPDRTNGSCFEWDSGSLWAGQTLVEPQQQQAVSVIYRLPVISETVTLSSTFPVTAAVKSVNLAVDREHANNAEEINARFLPLDPNVLVITNFTRQSLFGDVKQLRREIDAYTEDSNGLEFALDGFPVCNANNQGGVSCLYDDLDQLYQDIADTDDPQTKLRLENKAVEKRNELVFKIVEHIKTYILPSYSFDYIYLVGNDFTIPLYAYPDIDQKGYESLRGEDDTFDNRVLPEDTLYSVLATNHYPSDMPYRKIQPALSRSAPSIEAAVAMHKAYRESNGVLSLDASAVAGIAGAEDTETDLTSTTQEAVCKTFNLMGGFKPLLCDPLAPDGSAVLKVFTNTGTLVSVSGHALPYMINDLHSQAVLDAALDSSNLILMLGCHSGLATIGGKEIMPLVDAWGMSGSPSAGFSALALASNADFSRTDENRYYPDNTVYAERLHLLMTWNLFDSDTTLAQAYAAAIKDYGNPNDDLDRKTIRTYTIYGPPTYQIDLPYNNLLPKPASVKPAPDSFELQVSFEEVVSADGIFYQAQSPQGTGVLLQQYGHTLQPAIKFPVPSDVTDVVIQNRSSKKIDDLDPVVMGAYYLSDLTTYREPAYIGEPHDWKRYAEITEDSNGQKWATVAVGEWSQNGTQLLFEQTSIKLQRK